MIWSAPWERTRPALLALAVAVTVAPACLASWTAYPPTAPPAPLTRTLCPACTPACSNSACHAVSPDDGSAAASASSTVRGAAASSSAGATANSAAAPPVFIGRNATTASPSRQPVTPSPVSATTRSEEHTSELQSPVHLVCRHLL